MPRTINTCKMKEILDLDAELDEDLLQTLLKKINSKFLKWDIAKTQYSILEKKMPIKIMPTVSVEKAFDQLILRNHFDYENLSLNEKEVISNIVIKLKFISFFRTFCFVHFSMENYCWMDRVIQSVCPSPKDRYSNFCQSIFT